MAVICNKLVQLALKSTAVICYFRYALIRCIKKILLRLEDPIEINKDYCLQIEVMTEKVSAIMNR